MLIDRFKYGFPPDWEKVLQKFFAKSTGRLPTASWYDSAIFGEANDGSSTHKTRFNQQSSSSVQSSFLRLLKFATVVCKSKYFVLLFLF